MTGSMAMAVLCGVGLGLGIWVSVSAIPRIGRPRLIHRLAPYLVDVSPAARELVDREPVTPIPVLGLLFPSHGLQFAAGKLGSILGSTVVVSIRLRQAGLRISSETFRMHQLVAALVALAAAGGLSLLISDPINPAASVSLAIVAGVFGFLAPEWWLARRATSRLVRLRTQLPTILEFLSLSLAAGEGIGPALDRVSRSTGGELAGEFRRTVQRTQAGTPLVTALTELGRQLALPPLSSALDQFVGALERGSPLAEVLQAQAQDARDAAKRELLELAGRKEVLMMIPLVFLILPLSVLFAVFPGIQVLDFGF